MEDGFDEEDQSEEGCRGVFGGETEEEWRGDCFRGNIREVYRISTIKRILTIGKFQYCGRRVTTGFRVC
jgi:hypothetical protein